MNFENEPKIYQSLPLPPKKTGSIESKVIGSYYGFYKKRYGNRPVLTGKHHGILNRITKDLGEEKTLHLIKAFFEMDDPWFLTKSHDVPCFENNLTKISTFADQGTMFSRNYAQEKNNQNLKAVEEAVAFFAKNEK